ncbi:hypothetical protein HYPBUDRAFT_147522 [Hyphopichia burtonii NRRL Y-1933]|uniref:Uncharacterized protein n=1 Tax=Hyphopichia burtonii NRRL Y-1933 TaxID=984485 RepID=A0A1E4RP21_9ASCO|nr:hypothetical protein HYPBUDRAFT_147522 [Hyphopichia burtonii NRRL Y-1933]ODV69003.1 hypothetical protein HYPBUDRAFT_147522 [Hyphopichia burtonii NRRL Y-1933]
MFSYYHSPSDSDKLFSSGLTSRKSYAETSITSLSEPTPTKTLYPASYNRIISDKENYDLSGHDYHDLLEYPEDLAQELTPKQLQNILKKQIEPEVYIPTETSYPVEAIPHNKSPSRILHQLNDENNNVPEFLPESESPPSPEPCKSPRAPTPTSKPKAVEPLTPRKPYLVVSPASAQDDNESILTRQTTASDYFTYYYDYWHRKSHSKPPHLIQQSQFPTLKEPQIDTKNRDPIKVALDTSRNENKILSEERLSNEKNSPTRYRIPESIQASPTPMNDYDDELVMYLRKAIDKIKQKEDLKRNITPSDCDILAYLLEVLAKELKKKKSHGSLSQGIDNQSVKSTPRRDRELKKIKNILLNLERQQKSLKATLEELERVKNLEKQKDENKELELQKEKDIKDAETKNSIEIEREKQMDAESAAFTIDNKGKSTEEAKVKALEAQNEIDAEEHRQYLLQLEAEEEKMNQIELDIEEAERQRELQAAEKLSVERAESKLSIELRSPHIVGNSNDIQKASNDVEREEVSRNLQEENADKEQQARELEIEERLRCANEDNFSWDDGGERVFQKSYNSKDIERESREQAKIRRSKSRIAKSKRDRELRKTKKAIYESKLADRKANLKMKAELKTIKREARAKEKLEKRKAKEEARAKRNSLIVPSVNSNIFASAASENSDNEILFNQELDNNENQLKRSKSFKKSFKSKVQTMKKELGQDYVRHYRTSMGKKLITNGVQNSNMIEKEYRPETPKEAEPKTPSQKDPNSGQKAEQHKPENKVKTVEPPRPARKLNDPAPTSATTLLQPLYRYIKSYVAPKPAPKPVEDDDDYYTSDYSDVDDNLFARPKAVPVPAPAPVPPPTTDNSAQLKPLRKGKLRMKMPGLTRRKK